MNPNEFPFYSNVNADLRLLGAPNILIPFAQHTSSPRTNMVNHNLSQAMVVDGVEFNKIFTGEEYKMSEYTFGTIELEYDCEVVAMIPKYPPHFTKGIHNCPEIYVIVLTLEPNNVRHLDYFVINRYYMGSNGYGFPLKLQNLERIKVGEILEKNMPISSSPAMDGNLYGFGTNLNVAYGSFTETIEDAFLISESAAKKLQATKISRMIINCRMDRRPLNLNGDEFDEKFLPDIGSYVREDGILCAFRPIHWATCVSDIDPISLKKPLPSQDDIIYVNDGDSHAKILDLTFNVNRNKMNDCYAQAEIYLRENTKCWEAIYGTYLRYKGKYNLTPRMSTLLTTTIYRLIAQKGKIPSLEQEFRKEMKNYDIEGETGQVVDFIEVVVDYVAPRYISKGSKLTDLQGAKGVVGTIRPDDWMPIDEYGIRADICIDMNSPVARNNPGQFYEAGINRISEFVRRKCEQIYLSQGSEAAFETLLDWYNDVNPNYAKLIKETELTPEDRNDTVLDAIRTYPKIWIPPFLDKLCPTDDDYWNALVNIKSWAKKWDVKPSRIRFKTEQADGTPKEFISDELFSIGSKYFIHLNKFAEISAPGPASVSHIGIPIKPAFASKTYPVSLSPYKYGEDEIRVMMLDTDVREVLRFQNMMANSPKGVAAYISAILTSDNPMKIKRVPISNGDLFATSAVLNLFHNIAATTGIETKNTLVDMVDIPDELTEAIWESGKIDGVGDEDAMLDEGVIAEKRNITKQKKMRDMIEELTLEDDDSEEVLETTEEE